MNLEKITMKPEKVEELKALCLRRYNQANNFFNSTQTFSKAAIGKPLTEEAELPGFENRQPKFGEFIEKDFVVMMTDICKSTDIINRPRGVRDMFIIYYIYSAVVAKLVDEYKGTSTEFLGDGVLSLFDTDSGIHEAMKHAMVSSQQIMYARQYILNPFFLQYGLPCIDFGIGIDYGTTIVTRFGHSQDNDLKAFGKCVYEASKLSKSYNEVLVSAGAQSNWPTAENGILNFLNKQVGSKFAYAAYLL